MEYFPADTPGMGGSSEQARAILSARSTEEKVKKFFKNSRFFPWEPIDKISF